MGNVLFFFILFNSLVVSLILWLITFIGSFLYNPKQDLNRDVHFECGFFSINKSIPEYNINFIISAIFLLLYDIEFLLLIPLFFNQCFIGSNFFIAGLIFLITVLFSLLIDVESSTIKWYLN